MTRPLRLGILALANQDPTPSPSSYPLDPANSVHELVFEPVVDAWADRVIAGDQHLTDFYVAAARRLEQRGVDAITANCGYAVIHQAAVCSAVRVPVALSALLLAPTLLTMLPPAGMLGMIVADSRTLGRAQQAAAGLMPGDPRVAIGGMEMTPSMAIWRDEPFYETDWELVRRDLIATVASLLAQQPTVTQLLFECTGLSAFAEDVRCSFGLPVHDISSLLDLLQGGAPLPGGRP